FSSCAASPFTGPKTPVKYVGSSTIARFIQDAEHEYERLKFTINSEPESDGGEKAIAEGATDLAGVANEPSPETLRSGVSSALIGRDAIAVIVNAKNPITNLSISELRLIFTGNAASWSELGGPDLRVEPFIVSPGSATRSVFAETVLQGAQYRGCTDIHPDIEIIAAVAATPGGIGQISFSFLQSAAGVRAIGVGGEKPSVTNFEYPIARPLHLLWRQGRPEIEAFVVWARSPAGQQVVRRRFVGMSVVGSISSQRDDSPASGTLIALTETYKVYDGGINYYPHRPYELLTRYGELVRRIPNHRSENDETATPIQLPPGTYLVRSQTSDGKRPEFFVTVETGKTVEVDFQKLVREK
ncbi:MAG: phosphate transport system substrate-binding protein, partial [Planctomycetota bacterium]